MLEARLRQTQYELRVLILEVAIEEQKTVRQIEEQISKPRTLTTLAQLQLQSLTQEFEALRERKYQQSLQQSKKQRTLELTNVLKPRDLSTIVQFQLRALTRKFHREVETQRKEGEELASARAFVAAFPELFKQENFGESSIHQTINLSIHFSR